MKYLEKKLNARIIDLLIAGTSIETKNMTPEWKSFFERLKRFFAKWLAQMSKDLDPSKKKKIEE